LKVVPKSNSILLNFTRINHILDVVPGDIPNSKRTGNHEPDRHEHDEGDDATLQNEPLGSAELILEQIEEILSTNPSEISKDFQTSQFPTENRQESLNNPEPTWEETPEAKLKRVEALLFLSRKPQNLRKISELARLDDATQARTMIGQLNQRYDRTGRAFQIKQVAGGYQMLTRPQFSPWIERLDYLPRPLRLSQPAMETLTIIAYRQPIIKAEIEAIRGLACGEMLRQLLELNLIKIAGRSQKLGRPFLYITTKEFLTNFGLNNLQELPRTEQLSGTGLPEWPTSDINFDQPKHGSFTPQKEETLKGD